MTSQKFISFIRRAILPSVTLLLALSSVPDNSRLTAQAGQTGSPKLGSIIAEDYDVQTTDGKRVKLATLLGRNQPVLIDFWATWCGPCRLEIPHLIELANKYRERKLVVIGLTIEDPADDAEKVREFAKKLGINYQIAFAPRELYYGLTGGTRTALPQTLIYGGDGTLVRRIVGYNAKLIPYVLTEAVEAALKRNSAEGKQSLLLK
ncbi:MAG TPA: TlpA disulfide reductase family protein [Blastocatellia bacterium]|nr:TlpA disulfide reductase family protein [Blastocatellia bacterium]